MVCISNRAFRLNCSSILEVEENILRYCAFCIMGSETNHLISQDPINALLSCICILNYYIKYIFNHLSIRSHLILSLLDAFRDVILTLKKKDENNLEFHVI